METKTKETYLKLEHKLLTIGSRFALVILAFFLTKMITDTEERFSQVDQSIGGLRSRGEERDKLLAELMLEVEHRLTKVEARL